MKRLLIVGVMALSGLVLAACGGSSDSMAGMNMTNYKASSDCHISNTNFNYEGCDLAGLNLNGIDLQGDNLTMSNLSHVNFDGAYLEGATVTDATLKDVLTNKLTICTNGVHGPCTLRGLRGR